MIWGDMFFWPFRAAWMSVQFVIGILLFAFWIWMIVDCAKRKFKNDGEKIIWMILTIFTSWIGAIVYYIAVRTLNPKGLSKK